MDEPYNELILAYPDGRQVPPVRFRTATEAMTAALDYPGAAGAIVYHQAADVAPLEVIRVNADGSIDLGADVDDEDDEDADWTEEEIAENFRRGRVIGKIEQ